MSRGQQSTVWYRIMNCITLQTLLIVALREDHIVVTCSKGNGTRSCLECLMYRALGIATNIKIEISLVSFSILGMKEGRNQKMQKEVPANEFATLVCHKAFL